MVPRVRVNGVLVEDGRILLVEQHVSDKRGWAHPGGKVEPGETLEKACAREVKEETGLDVSVGRLLYVTERMTDEDHIVIISFQVNRMGGVLGTGNGEEFAIGKIKNVRMVPIGEMRSLGFSATYCDLVGAGFPNAGRYMGTILND